ncbi:MAG: hypothetical protein KJS66_10445 [Acidobacteria bacterium]|nr:hypothetical protein [Acidobacteriota bacterium]
MRTAAGPLVVDGRGHRPAVDDLFRATMLAGEPMPFFLHGLDRYTRFSLDWYFNSPSGRVFVAIDDSRVLGYGLVATDPGAYARHLKRSLSVLAAHLTFDFVVGRIDPESRAFYRDRIRDSWLIWRDRRRIDVHDEPHVHLNVIAEARRGTIAAALIEAVDTTVRVAGHRSWIGEVNAEEGRRRRALERVVGTVLDERPNLTASRLTNRTIVRYTVRRSLPA